MSLATREPGQEPLSAFGALSELSPILGAPKKVGVGWV